MSTDIPALDLHRIHATVGRDDNDLPTLVLTDGQTEIVLSSSDDGREDLAGARRIVGAVWDYQQIVVARRETEYRVESLERLHGVEPSGPVAARTSEASVNTGGAARLAELGPRTSNSGAH